MNSSIVLRRVLAAGASLFFGSSVFLAADSTAAVVEAPGVTLSGESGVTANAPVALSHGVEDVLKLTKAQVNDDLVLRFIHYSGESFSLTPDDILYLRDQGVSDRVINAMLDQNKHAANQAGAAASVAPTPQAPPDTSVAPGYAQEPGAVPPASSPDYGMPYSSGDYGYYGYGAYPYYYSYAYYPYYPYPYYWGSPFSFGFVVGSHGHGHDDHFHGHDDHFHGHANSLHGGFHAQGGFHGGGTHGGFHGGGAGHGH